MFLKITNVKKESEYLVPYDISDTDFKRACIIVCDHIFKDEKVNLHFKDTNQCWVYRQEEKLKKGWIYNSIQNTESLDLVIKRIECDYDLMNAFSQQLDSSSSDNNNDNNRRVCEASGYAPTLVTHGMDPMYRPPNKQMELVYSELFDKLALPRYGLKQTK